MDSKPKFLTGFLYNTDDVEEINIENLLMEFRKAARGETERIRLIKGNIFENPKAIARQQNEVLIFELDDDRNDFYPRSFRGFLYKDDTINGKIKYSLDAKLSNDLFSGIYQYDSKGKLVICLLQRNLTPSTVQVDPSFRAC